jgi:hypothetical protein
MKTENLQLLLATFEEFAKFVLQRSLQMEDGTSQYFR